MQRGSNVHFAWIGATNLKYLYGAWPVAELFDQVAGPLPVASANECACFTKCQHKSFKIFFSTLKDWNNHVIVRKEWNFYWDITTKQGLIGQKQFQPDIWDLWQSHSWRGENQKYHEKVNLVARTWRVTNFALPLLMKFSMAIQPQPPFKWIIAVPEFP